MVQNTSDAEYVDETREASNAAGSLLIREWSVHGEASVQRTDWLAVEEPLEIRAQGPDQKAVNIAVTMRTPGHDTELAVGFLFTEGLLKGKSGLAEIGPRHPESGVEAGNIVTVHLTQTFDAGIFQRNFFATSSCGICGKSSLEQIAVRCSPAAPGPFVPRELLIGLPAKLRDAQSVFERTGGLHATGLFDIKGNLIYSREDVGRHNAVDKLIGRALLDNALPLVERIMVVSGRLSFEIVQKAAVAGVGLLCAVSAPSSLAVATADRLRITLVGFLRGDGFNVYTHPDRIVMQECISHIGADPLVSERNVL